MARLHERAVRILAEVGVRVTEPRLRKRLQGKRGLSFVGDRVMLTPELVAQTVNLCERQKKPAPAQPKTAERISIMTGGHARHILDLATGSLRPFTEKDAVEMAKLTDALRVRDVLGEVPDTPQDLPPTLRNVAQYRIALEWCRGRHYASVSCAAEARFIREMAKVAGKNFGLELYLISPLRLEGNELEMVLDYLETCPESEKPIPVGIASMPTMGLSAPVDPLSLFVLGIAESLGGCVLMRLALEGEANVGFGRINAYPCDFQSGALVVGTPEAALIEVVRRDFDRFYRHGAFGRALRTMSPVPGIQAAAEKAAGAVVCALAGYETFHGGGLLALDEIFSPVQLLIDCDIRDYALQVARGFEPDNSFDDVAVLRDALAAESDPLPFLTHPTTVAGFRKVFSPSALFQRAVCRKDVMPQEDILARARSEAQRLIASHDYRLDAAPLREIERIYRRATEELG